MARHTAVLFEERPALLHHRTAARTAREPGFIIVGFHYRHPADHAGVIGAAIFGAEDVITPGPGSLEPVRLVTPRHNVVFQPEGRQIETVDHVFARQRQFHRAAG